MTEEIYLPDHHIAPPFPLSPAMAPREFWEFADAQHSSRPVIACDDIGDIYQAITRREIFLGHEFESLRARPGIADVSVHASTRARFTHQYRSVGEYIHRIATGNIQDLQASGQFFAADLASLFEELRERLPQGVIGFDTDYTRLALSRHLPRAL